MSWFKTVDVVYIDVGDECWRQNMLATLRWEYNHQHPLVTKIYVAVDVEINYVTLLLDVEIWKVPDIECGRFGKWPVIFVPIEVALENWSQCSRILGFPTSAILNWLSFSKNRLIDRPFSDKYLLIRVKFGSFREKMFQLRTPKYWIDFELNSYSSVFYWLPL